MAHQRNLKQIPGSVIYTGTKKTAESLVTMITYSERGANNISIEDFNQCMEYQGETIRWIDFVGVDQTNDLQEIGELFTIHPLILEDIANIQNLLNNIPMKCLGFQTPAEVFSLESSKRCTST